MRVIKGKQPCAVKVVVYGPEGVGKSTFASQFPEPLFIDTENGSMRLDVARTDKPLSWAELMSYVNEFAKNPQGFKTLVLDTAHWAERLLVTKICEDGKVDGIEGYGYGKGYTYLQEGFGKLLDALEKVKDNGRNVVITAHAKIRKIEQPEEIGGYDHWEMKTSKNVAPLIKEWGDMVLFANYKTMVYNVDGQGAGKGKNKAQGGRRVMYTTHTPYWDAKNRFDLPDELPLDYESIRQVIEPSAEPVKAASAKARAAVQEPAALSVPQGFTELPADEFTEPPADEFAGTVFQNKSERLNGTVSDMGNPITEKPDIGIPTSDNGIPKTLKRLMDANGVTEDEIRKAVSDVKHYFPSDMHIRDYPADFVNQVLVAAWDQVFSIIISTVRLMDNPPF